MSFLWLQIPGLAWWLGQVLLFVLVARRGVRALRPPAVASGPPLGRGALLGAYGPALEVVFATLGLGLVLVSSARRLASEWRFAGLERGWSTVRGLLSAAVDGLPFYLIGGALALGAWSILLACSALARLERRGRCVFGVGVLSWILGCLPLLTWGALRFLRRLGAEVDSGRLFADDLIGTIDEARDDFTLAGAAAALVFVVSALCVALGLGKGPRAPTPEPLAPTRSVGRRVVAARWCVTLGIVVGAGTAAGVLAWLGTRLAWENAHPIDPRFAFAHCGLCIPPPPGVAGVGPHRVREGIGVVLGSKGHAEVNGLPVSHLDELYDSLRSKKELWQKVHPRQKFPGYAVVNARGAKEVGELAKSLEVLARAGFLEVAFLFSEVRREDRPLFGQLDGIRNTALQAHLSTSEEGCTESGTSPVSLAKVSQLQTANFLRALARAASESARPCLLLDSANVVSTKQPRAGAEDEGRTDDL